MSCGPSSLSIVVPVGGAGEGFELCLGALKALDPPPAEILLVLDEPEDQHETAIEASGLAARVIVLPERRGPAVARNRGARAASGAILFFVDADVAVASDCVARVLSFFDQSPEFEALIGSYDNAPGDPHFLSQYRNLLHHYVHQHGALEASTFWGACGAVRRGGFDEVGGFDEGFDVPSIEDIELGARLRKKGLRIALVKDLQVKHLKRWRMRNMLETDLFRRAAPWTELMLRGDGLINDLNVKTGERLSVVAAFLLLGGLLTGWLAWPAALVGLVGLVSILVLNFRLFGFFRRLRGTGFMLGAIFWHWIYLLVCGLGFLVGWARHRVKS